MAEKHNGHWVIDELDQMLDSGARVIRQHWECSCGEQGETLVEFREHAGSEAEPMGYQQWLASRPKDPLGAAEAMAVRVSNAAREISKVLQPPEDAEYRSWILGLFAGTLMRNQYNVKVEQSDPTGGVLVFVASGGKRWRVTIDPA